MEVQDGFITSIFNYCDRWCEKCAFTSWCRLFAGKAEAQASLDPSLKALTEAPPLPHEAQRIPEWLEKALEEAQAAVDKMTKEELEETQPTHVSEEDPLLQRATAYSIMVHEWLGDRGATRDSNDPRAIIGWFGWMIPAKLARALSGIGWADPDHEEPTEDDGSAKVALVSIRQSRAAWQQIAVTEPSSQAVARAIADLDWLEREIDRMFPRARTFIRPAFDEPDEVACLLADCDNS